MTPTLPGPSVTLPPRTKSSIFFPSILANSPPLSSNQFPYTTINPYTSNPNTTNLDLQCPTPPQSFRALIGTPLSTATPLDSTLLIIDAQNEYATGKLKTVDVDSTSSAIASLLGRYRDQGGDVVHVLHRTPKGAPVFDGGEGRAEGEEMVGVKAQGAEKVVEKHYPSSFAGTDLHAYLQKKGAKKLVLTGYMAHVCVSTTARQAAELGYDVVLAEDAIGDRDIPGVKGDEVTKMALLELGDAFGTVVKSESIK